MVTQMLYGEICRVLQSSGDSLCIEFQGIVGWVFRLNIRQSHHLDHTEMLFSPVTLFQTDSRNLLLSMGSRVPARSLYPPQPPAIMEVLHALLDVPAQQGGRSVFGLDSPNFVNLFFTLLGKAFPLKLEEQCRQGQSLDFISETRPGDVAFFLDEAGKIGHAGILGTDLEIFHPFGCLRPDRLDSYGIFNEDLQRHTHHLIFIKRILA